MSKDLQNPTANEKASVVANSKANREAPETEGGAPPIITSEEALARRTKYLEDRKHILRGARVYLSGPMDFVASRKEEKRNGWRTRVSEFLRNMETIVYNPWDKPDVVGMPEYGKEDEFTANDGFGFARYQDRFPNWTTSGLDEREKKSPPKRPLLPYLERLNSKIPKRYDLEQDRYVENEDWLILDPGGIG